MSYFFIFGKNFDTKDGVLLRSETVEVDEGLLAESFLLLFERPITTFPSFPFWPVPGPGKVGTFGVLTGSIGELVRDRDPKNRIGFSGLTF